MANINPMSPFQETWKEKQDRLAAEQAAVGVRAAPFQETWKEKQDRLAAEQATTGVQAAPFQETWVEKRDRENRERSLRAGPIAGLANGGSTSRVIPGTVDRSVADDVTINAKKGEYVLSVEDVDLLGGPQAVAAMVKRLRQKAGVPTATGPKRHDEPDHLGRMDKQGLRGIAGVAAGGAIYVDERGIATTQRPMTLQENYGMPRNVPAGQIPYTGGGQPVGNPSGISRPGIATGAPQATQVPVNPRNLPVPRANTAPIASSPAAPPAGNPARGFTMGAEGATVSPARPTKPTAQIGHTPAEPLENIDSEVRSRIGSGSRRFVGPQQPEVAPIATPGKAMVFGGRGGAQPVLPGGGIAGALYRYWSDKTGRYVPGLEQAWGGKPTTYNDIRGELRNHLTGIADLQPMPAHGASQSAAAPPASPAAGPVEPPTRYENLGLGPQNLSRTSSGRVLAPVKPVGIADGDGTGYAIVGGKRIDYRDIGTGRDPLASRRTDGIATAPDGQTVLLGNAAGYRPSRDVDWSPGSANMRAAQAGIAGDLGMVQDGRGGYRLMNQGERDAAGLTSQREYAARIDQEIRDELAYIAANMGNQYDGDQKIEAAKMRIAALQGQNAQIRKGIADDQALEGQKYVADAGVAARRIDGNAHVEAARLATEGRERAALAEGERERQKEETAGRRDDRKRRDDLVKSYLNRYDWGNISPTAANEFAGLLADTDGKGYVTIRDPSGTHGDVLVHQGIEQALRGAYGKIRTADQFRAYLDQARKLGGNQAPLFRTQIKNSAGLPLMRSKQAILPEENRNG